jgi:predicted small secreted protein
MKLNRILFSILLTLSLTLSACGGSDDSFDGAGKNVGPGENTATNNAFTGEGDSAGGPGAGGGGGGQTGESLPIRVSSQRANGTTTKSSMPGWAFSTSS